MASNAVNNKMATDRALLAGTMVECKICERRSSFSEEAFVTACLCQKGGPDMVHRRCFASKIIHLYETAHLLRSSHSPQLKMFCDRCNSKIAFDSQEKTRLVSCDQFATRLMTRKCLFSLYILFFLFLAFLCALVTIDTTNRLEDVPLMHYAYAPRLAFIFLLFATLLTVGACYFFYTFFTLNSIRVTNIESCDGPTTNNYVNVDSKLTENLNRSLQDCKPSTIKDSLSYSIQINRKESGCENREMEMEVPFAKKLPRDSNVMRIQAGFPRKLSSTLTSFIFKCEDGTPKQNVDLRIHLGQI